MPSRNIVKFYAPNSYYHLYNRGVNKRTIFKESADYEVFLSLFKRYLSGEAIKNKQRHYYKDLSKDVELLAYCLLPNHFHLLVYQRNPLGMTELIRCVMTSYARFFNKKYQRVGALFQDRFKASLIDNEAYLWHISRYIHLNSLDVKQAPHEYLYSSYPYYIDQKVAAWLKPSRILALHHSQQGSYSEFVHDYIGHKQALKEIKSQLAFVA